MVIVLLMGLQAAPELVDVRKIWDRAPHNAFTDLLRHKDRWWCVFREGRAHVSPDGALRVLTSADGAAWESAALLRREGADLRDAKISVMPDGRFLLMGAAAFPPDGKGGHQTMSWTSDDGRAWSEGKDVADRDVWLWRVTWHLGTAYGFGYGCKDDAFVRLYSSPDGVAFKTLIERAHDQGLPNESSILFEKDGTALCLLRRDGRPNTGLLGTASAPYTSWTWKDLGVRIGGPHMVRLPDGRRLAAVRLYDKAVRTSLCWIDAEAGTLKECLKLPSGGDTSYAGLVYHDGLLWVSYYSSHEGKSSIYLARVQVKSDQ